MKILKQAAVIDRGESGCDRLRVRGDPPPLRASDPKTETRKRRRQSFRDVREGHARWKDSQSKVSKVGMEVAT